MTYKLVLILIVSLLFLQFFTETANAAVDSCTVSVSSSNLAKNVDRSLTFTVTNTSSVPIIWVKITSPSSNFFIGGGSTTGWQSTIESGISNTYGNGSLAISDQVGFGVDLRTADADVSAENFTVTASDSDNGSSPATCTGSTGVSISGDGTPPDFSEVTVSDIATSTVKVNITTTEASTVQIQYGTTSSYGSTATDTSLSTTHAVELSGLSSNSTYHFNVIVSDSSSNSNELGDSTFLTAKSTTTINTNVVIATAAPATTTTTTRVLTPTPKPVDKTPPTVSLDTDLTKPFKEAPKITGKATDSSGISRVEYSLDGGKNWLVVENLQSGGAFDFQSPVLDDDNYKVQVRAKDNNSNWGYTKILTMVIDRLPPQVGGTLMSTGAQALLPNLDGMIMVMAGLDQKITLSAVGGPVTIDLISGKRTFSMVKNLENGLWSGVLSFDQPGIYPLEARALDGAGNKTRRVLNTVIVVENGQVTSNGQAINAGVSLYYFDNTTKRFVLWDAKPYSEENPQQTDKNGKYRLFIPPGKYYVQIKAPGYETLKSEIFTTDRSLPLNSNFELKKASGFQLGPFWIAWPNFNAGLAQVSVQVPVAPKQATQIAGLIGQELPQFILKTDTETLESLSLRGKPTILTFLNTWLPQTAEQLNFINQLALNKELKNIVIIPQESVSSVAVFKKRGGYNLSIFADPDGVTVVPLQIQSIPVHVFINRKGIVQSIKLGVLTKEEMLDNLIN